MELVLTLQPNGQVSVACDGQFSHTFNLAGLVLDNRSNITQLLYTLEPYGQVIYNALFRSETLAWQVLNSSRERIVLATNNADLDGVPWEYAYGPEGFLVLQHHFIRSLPAQQRITPPVLESGLHIVAVPTNPLDESIVPLNIEGEWEKLQEVIYKVPYALTLERTCPPTLRQLQRLVAGQHHLVVHFMGHGEQYDGEAALYFECDDGGLDMVTAQEFMHATRDSIFLVTLNACESAAPGTTSFSNFAAEIVRQGIPYALGMRMGIADDDARIFARVFYSELAHGTSVEEALLQGRLALAESPRCWAVGVPVLYTFSKTLAPGFAQIAGVPVVKVHRPKLEVSSLPGVESKFQGYTKELKQLGGLLTGGSRPQLLTIYGLSGQGKTALAREAVERFCFAWPGGIWATSLANLPSREVFVANLARFLGIIPQQVANLVELERLVINRLKQRRTLIVLDNTEILVEAVQRNDKSAMALAHFLREQLPCPPVSLLVTARFPLEWEGEAGCELGGLTPQEGARLFQQSASQRMEDVEMEVARLLSRQVDGHPFSLRLLGVAFNMSQLSLQDFVAQYEEILLKAKNIYVEVDQHQRSLYACLEASWRDLDENLQTLLSKLTIFHAPFFANCAVMIVDSQADHQPTSVPLTSDSLQMLWQRGLLERKITSFNDAVVELYRISPIVRFYTKHYLDVKYNREALLRQFGKVYLGLIALIFERLSDSAATVHIAQQLQEDLERGSSFVEGLEKGFYLFHWGFVLCQLGDLQHSLKLTEYALEIAQGQDRPLEYKCHNNLALMYRAIRQLQPALAHYDRAISILREIGEKAEEAIVLCNMALVYIDMNQADTALQLLNQTLPIFQEVGDIIGEINALNNIASICIIIGQPQNALGMLEQALVIVRGMGKRSLEASLLNNMANAYEHVDEWQKAVDLYEQSLIILRELGNKINEAITLFNLAGIYQNNEQPQRALSLYNQALAVEREVNNRVGEVDVLYKIMLVYESLNRIEEAIDVMEYLRVILREMGEQAKEVDLLRNLAVRCWKIGQQEKALDWLRQVLSLQREMKDRDGQIITLKFMGGMSHSMGQMQQSMEFYNQASRLLTEGDDRSSIADLLKNFAEMDEVNLPENPLSVWQEIGDSDLGTRALCAIASDYNTKGYKSQALSLYEQTLPFLREIEDRESEANVLNNMGVIYLDMNQPERALELLNQSLSLKKEGDDRASEAATLTDIALVLYQYLHRSEEAIMRLEQATAMLVSARLQHESGGHTIEYWRHALALMQIGAPIGKMGEPTALEPDVVGQIIKDTVKSMRGTLDDRSNWRKTVVKALKKVQSDCAYGQNEVDFFNAVLSLLDNQKPVLLDNHPYFQVIAAILKDINLEESGIPDREDVSQAIINLIKAQDKAAKYQIIEAHKAIYLNPVYNEQFEELIKISLITGDKKMTEVMKENFAILREYITSQDKKVPEENASVDVELISRSITALLGNPVEKMDCAEYLTEQMEQIADNGLKDLLRTILRGLFGSDLSQLGQELKGDYLKAWETICWGVQAEAVDPLIIEFVVETTREVLASDSDIEKREGWRAVLFQIRSQVTVQGAQRFAALLEEVISLLDARGNPAGLGQELTGLHAAAWREIIKGIKGPAV